MFLKAAWNYLRALKLQGGKNFSFDSTTEVSNQVLCLADERGRVEEYDDGG